MSKITNYNTVLNILTQTTKHYTSNNKFTIEQIKDRQQIVCTSGNQTVAQEALSKVILLNFVVLETYDNKQPDGSTKLKLFICTG